MRAHNESSKHRWLGSVSWDCVTMKEEGLASEVEEESLRKRLQYNTDDEQNRSWNKFPTIKHNPKTEFMETNVEDK